MNLQSQAGWKWYGFAGHHICSARCQYHLTTSIGGKYLVSTIGEFVPDPLREPRVLCTVGYERLYETMVFHIDGDDEHGDPKRLDHEAAECVGYNVSIEAERGHYAMCEKYAALAKTGGKP